MHRSLAFNIQFLSKPGIPNLHTGKTLEALALLRGYVTDSDVGIRRVTCMVGHAGLVVVYRHEDGENLARIHIAGSARGHRVRPALELAELWTLYAVEAASRPDISGLNYPVEARFRAKLAPEERDAEERDLETAKLRAAQAYELAMKGYNMNKEPGGVEFYAMFEGLMATTRLELRKGAVYVDVKGNVDMTAYDMARLFYIVRRVVLG